MMKKGITLLIFAIAALLGGCKKDGAKPAPAPGPRLLEVQLDPHYLPAAKTDSAIAIWESGGQVQQFRFVTVGDTLRLPLAPFKEGQGTLTLQLYSQVKRQGRDLQFEKRWPVRLSHQESITCTGPTGYEDEPWMPRVILKAPSSIVAIVGLRPADPYFSLRNLPAMWPLIEMEKGYYEQPGGVRFAGYKLWKCDGTCGDRVEDRNFFAGMGTQVGNKPWTWIYIGIGLFSKTDQTGAALSFGCPR